MIYDIFDRDVPEESSQLSLFRSCLEVLLLRIVLLSLLCFFSGDFLIILAIPVLDLLCLVCLRLCVCFSIHLLYLLSI